MERGVQVMTRVSDESYFQVRVEGDPGVSRTRQEIGTYPVLTKTWVENGRGPRLEFPSLTHTG